MSALPIDSALPALKSALARGTGAVLQAPPGAGKTMRVPLALLDEGWLAGGRIVMLEPRRLAARAAASFMARMLGEEVGDTVGYRIRFDTRVGPATRVEVVTEGILARMLRDDPALEGVGLVIFDEFHERSLHADLGLALTLQVQSLIRPDLRVLVMSATLETEAIAALLGGVPVLRAEGRAYAVETRYLDARPSGRLEDRVASAVQTALEEYEGDVLVFLPGTAEIRNAHARLMERGVASARVRIEPLFGDLPQDAQDRAIAPSPRGYRKVVLATSIAETSLTIEGVRVVIDAGLMRVPRFSPRTGLTRLDTTTVTRDSAEQRRGRAGRLGPGVCYRLWTRIEEDSFVPRRRPEILDADLAPLALELATWGVRDPAELAWLDPPPSAAFAQAGELLAELRAIDATGAITPHGRRMAALPAHPRLAHMILAGHALGEAGLACDIAALLEERDLLGRTDVHDADIRTRVALLAHARGDASAGGPTRGRARRDPASRRANAANAHPARVHRAVRAADQLRRALRLALRHDADASSTQPVPAGPAGSVDIGDAGLLLAFAYPDRIARRRGPRGRFLLRSGRAATLPPESPLAAEEFIVAADVDDRDGHGRIFLAASVSRDRIESHFQHLINSEARVDWSAQDKSVRAVRLVRLGELTLEESALQDPPASAVTEALLEGIAREGIDALAWTDEARSTRARIRFLHGLEPDQWPDTSDAALLENLGTWLGPHLPGLRSLEEARSIDLERALLSLLAGDARRRLDPMAPTHFTVPSGSRIRIDYSDPGAPAVSVRLQEVFGLTRTPMIGGGRVPLTFKLLSPAQRPVQVTRDLESFWHTGYFEVKKDLKSRYPKHAWPEDPLRAEATRGTRPRRGG